MRVLYKGPSPELLLYMQRVEDIVSGVVGSEYYDLMRQADSIDRNTEPEAAEPLFRRAFTLFQDGCMRASSHPEEYNTTITWAAELTLHGRGHPGLEEALFEEYISLSDEYSLCLNNLATRCIADGRQAEAQLYEEFKRQVENFGVPPPSPH
jgi:hypothetical protein